MLVLDAKSRDLLAVSVLLATVLTALSYAVGLSAGWITSLSYLEVFSVWTSYACTYLCVKQSRHNYFFGLISVFALMLLFYNGGNYGSAALNLYLIPTVIYGWFRWGKDTNTRPVTSAFKDGPLWIAGYIGITGATYLAVFGILTYFGGTLPYADSAVLVLSILAQFLMDNKKIESWIVWIIVNIISIPLYIASGYPLVAFQFVFFLGNAFWGFYAWYTTTKQPTLATA